jgi:hypothetical protein
LKTLNEKKTIQHVSYLLGQKHRYAFVTYTRSSILSALGELKGEKKPPKYFAKSIMSGLTNQDPMFSKALQKDFVSGIEHKIDGAGLKEVYFYDSSYLEYYINNNHDIFDTFMSYFFKHNRAVVVSFQYKNLISRYFAKDSAFIHVPYNDFYDKVDSVADQIAALDGQYDLCILDCPMFSSAIAPKIWEKTNMSIIDLGKSLTAARAVAKARG